MIVMFVILFDNLFFDISVSCVMKSVQEYVVLLANSVVLLYGLINELHIPR